MQFDVTFPLKEKIFYSACNKTKPKGYPERTQNPTYTAYYQFIKQTPISIYILDFFYPLSTCNVCLFLNSNYAVFKIKKLHEKLEALDSGF